MTTEKEIMKDMITAFKQSFCQIIDNIRQMETTLELIEEGLSTLESILEEINGKICPTQQVNEMLERMQDFLLKEKQNNDGAGCSKD